MRRLLLRSLRSAGRDIHLVLDPIRLGLSIPQAFVLLLLRRPAAIFTTGGYVAIPTLLAASVLRIPSVLWEGNVVPGRSVRFVARLATLLAVSYAETATAPRPRGRLRDRHADPVGLGRGPRRGPGDLRRPSGRADPARVRRLAGRAADQRRRDRGPPAPRRSGAGRARHRRRRVRRRARRARAAAGGAARPLPAVRVPPRRDDRGARRRRPRGGPRRLLDARGGRRVRAAHGDRPVSARGRPPAAQRGDPRRRRGGRPGGGRGPRCGQSWSRWRGCSPIPRATP